MENEEQMQIMQLKTEVYDANKAVQNINKILARIAQIVGVEEGSNIDDLFSKLTEAFEAKE